MRMHPRLYSPILSTNSLDWLVICNRRPANFVSDSKAGLRLFRSKTGESFVMGRLLLILILCAGAAFGQQRTATLKGQIADEFGGVIVGATVTVVDANGVEKTVTTNSDGAYVLNGLAPGKYSVKVSAKGFAADEKPDVELTAGRSEQLSVTLKVTIEQQKVTVSAHSSGVNTEPDSNVGSIVLK